MRKNGGGGQAQNLEAQIYNGDVATLVTSALLLTACNCAQEKKGRDECLVEECLCEMVSALRMITAGWLRKTWPGCSLPPEWRKPRNPRQLQQFTTPWFPSIPPTNQCESMSTSASKEELSQAILQQVEHGLYPESEDVASADIPSDALPALLQAVGRARDGVKVGERNVKSSRNLLIRYRANFDN